MDFSWSPEEEELYRRARDFSSKPRSSAATPRGDFPRALWSEWGEFGFLGLCVPEVSSGMGLSATATARTVEAFGYGCADTGLVFSALAHLFACAMPIAEHGSAEQRSTLLPRLVRGEAIGANAITEADAGSDVFALKTSARREGEHYVLTGEKSYVTNAPVADVFLVYAQTRPEYGYLGLSAFLVERGTKGLTIGRPFEKIGLQSAPISSIYFDDCKIAVASRLGEEGQGAPIFNSSMVWERACLFAMYLGVMERLLERSVEHARGRKQFKIALGKNQAISHRIVDMKLRLESARLLLYRACWRMDQKQDATVEIAMSKIAISEAAVQCALDAIQIHGGLGVIAETGIEQALRDAIPGTIFSGTSEMQRELIARRLGL